MARIEILSFTAFLSPMEYSTTLRLFQKFIVMIPDTLPMLIYTDHHPEQITDYLDLKSYRQGYGKKYL